jgi:DNA-cytosine methyltransferase
MKQKYKVLDLFSGLGGFSLGLERTGHFETVAFCDNDKFSKAILDKHWKGIKVYDDVREITKEKFKEDGIEFPDIITGGFPCQPFSVAGKQKGTGDDRHLWPEMFRIIKAFKPRFVIGENVRGIVNIQDGVVFETVCTNLEDEGYEVQPFNIPAAAVGAPHRRERIWFIAVREEPMVDSDNIRFEQHNETTETTSRRGTSATSQSTSNVGNSEYNGSPTSEIRRGNEKINGGTEERQNNSFEFERTSRSEDNGNVSENVADTENGRGQPSQSERWQGTKRGSIDSRGIEREGQDLSPTTDRINVADTHDEGLRTRIGGSDNDHETESRIGGADGEGGSSDVERNNSTSTKVEGMDVADTESIGSDVGRRSEHSETWNGQREIGGENSQDDANSNEERLQGFRQSRNQLNKRFSLRSEGSEGEHGTVGQGWWSVEPNVGRVAHGVPGRVYRLKGLGNSIVPQIVEEIGKALIKATRES